MPELMAGHEDALFDKVWQFLEDDVSALLRLAREGATFFCDGSKQAFANALVSGHRTTWSLNGPEFPQWLEWNFYINKKKVPKPATMKDVIRNLTASAIYEGERHEVHVRIASHGGKIYYDLGDENGNAVEIAVAGWRVISDPPVRFLRSSKTVPLPAPERGGSIEQLRPFVSNFSDADFELYLGVLVDVFDPCVRPHPLLNIIGPDGSGKTTGTRIARRFTDPVTIAVDRKSELRALPEKAMDLFVDARYSLALSYDNVSQLSEKMSAAICQITSGTGCTTRKFYTNAEEITICSGPRLVMFNGLTNVVAKGDLAGRQVLIQLKQMTSFKDETKFWQEFEQVRAQIFGALLDRACRGLGRIPDIQLSSTRMVDFAKWGTACESERGAFMGAWDVSAEEALADVIEKNPVALAVREFMTGKESWRGTTTELLRLLEKLDRIEENPSKWKNWPRDPGAFGERLWETAISPLQKSGIKVSRHRLPDGKRTKQLELRRIAPSETATRTAGPAEANAEPPKGARDSESAALVPLRRVK
jgi:hypothetical protein